jgi:hypothetical protein
MGPEEPTGQELRASDAERDRAMDRLRDAAGAGRLTLEELSDRIDTALRAKTRGELERIVADLPAETAPAAMPARTRRTFLGIMGGDTLRGPMRLADQATIVNVMGGVDLDLSQAKIEGGGSLTIRIFSIMGGSTIRVPRGVRIDRSGLSLMGGDSIARFDDPPPGDDAPVIHIRSFNLMGGNSVKPASSRGRGGRRSRHHLHGG